jgi:hypothetical protein
MPVDRFASGPARLLKPDLMPPVPSDGIPFYFLSSASRPNSPHSVFFCKNDGSSHCPLLMGHDWGMADVL